MTRHDVVIVHGVGNWRPNALPTEAAATLADEWSTSLAAGYATAGLDHVPPPRVHAAYYADLLNDADAQGALQDDVGSLGQGERELLLAWLQAAGLPPEPGDGQAMGTMPIRQALDWFARRRGMPSSALARIAVALMPEVYSYLTSPKRRGAARDLVADTVRATGARVVIAHSLGSIVAYEALHAHALPSVELLVTLGSPLGLPDGVFEALDPAPTGGRGSRPSSLACWTNIADPGDLVAVPRRLGDRFPVDSHHEEHIAALDFHTMRSYLTCGLTATAVVPYLS